MDLELDDEEEVTLDLDQSYLKYDLENLSQKICIVYRKTFKTKLIWYIKDYREKIDFGENQTIIESDVFTSHYNMNWRLILQYHFDEPEGLKILLEAVDSKIITTN